MQFHFKICVILLHVQKGKLAPTISPKSGDHFDTFFFDKLLGICSDWIILVIIIYNKIEI